MEKKDKVHKIVSLLAKIEYKEGMIKDAIGADDIILFNPAFELADMILNEILIPREFIRFYDLTYMEFNSFSEVVLPDNFERFYKKLTDEKVT